MKQSWSILLWETIEPLMPFVVYQEKYSGKKIQALILILSIF